MKEHTYAVIMAGGGGTRLWPLSRREKPKQLLPLLGERTLLQATVERAQSLFPAERILIVTVADQAAEIRRQVPAVPDANYLLEPQPRGTASAIGLAATVLSQRDPKAVMAVLASDHFIRNIDLFNYIVMEGLELAEQGYLVTLGIAPTAPSTAYGYIQQGAPLEGSLKYPAYHVKRFIEKPDERTAQSLLRSGDHTWNSAIFIWSAQAILGEFEKQMPELSAAMGKIRASWGKPAQAEILERTWAHLKNETVDYGIMEHAEQVVVLPASGLGWTDVGSWETLFEVLFPDMNGNVSTAQHLAVETHNTLVYGQNADRLIVTIGIDDTVLVDAGDVLLVCKADQSQRVREVVEHLRKHRQEKYL